MNAYIANEISKIMAQSPTLQASDSTRIILSHTIADYINANFELKPKAVWYGIDAEAKVKYHKQQLAIFTSYRKKEETCKSKKETQLLMKLLSTSGSEVRSI